MTQTDDNEISFALEKLSLDSESEVNDSSNNNLVKNILEAIDILRNRKKKRPDVKAIYDIIKNNYNVDIRENEIQNVINEMINKKVIFNKKTDKGLDSFYQNRDIDDITPLDFSYLFETKTSKNFEEEAYCNLTKTLEKSSIPQAKDFETPFEKTEILGRENFTIERLKLKFEAKISTMKNYVDCEFSEINEKLKRTLLIA